MNLDKKGFADDIVFQDEVVAARPDIDQRVEQLVSKGRWQVPGYKEVSPNVPYGFVASRVQKANHSSFNRNSETFPSSRCWITYLDATAFSHCRQLLCSIAVLSKDLSTLYIWNCCATCASADACEGSCLTISALVCCNVSKTGVPRRTSRRTSYMAKNLLIVTLVINCISLKQYKRPCEVEPWSCCTVKAGSRHSNYGVPHQSQADDSQLTGTLYSFVKSRHITQRLGSMHLQSIPTDKLSRMNSI